MEKKVLIKVMKMQVANFKDYITEDKKEKPFLRLLIITDEPEEAKTSYC